tara:strand:- start:1332 stop:1805 length:474 start_codon:yes stop_codon:yes gene_type:complete
MTDRREVEESPCWIAVDPGLQGGMALVRGDDSPVLKPFTTEGEFLNVLESVPGNAEAIVEEIPPYVGRAIPSSAAFKLGKNYGFEVGALRALGFRVNLVKPQKWQAGLGGLRGLEGAARKRRLKDHAQRLFPKVEGLTLKTADALLIFDYWKNNRVN